MTLEPEEKESIKKEYEKISEITLYVAELCGASPNSNAAIREYISYVGLAIYSKIS